MGVARLQVWAAPALLVVGLLTPALVTVGLGVAATLAIFAMSVRNSVRISAEEEEFDLVKSTAAEECERIDSIAKGARRVRKLPGTGLISKGANLAAPSEHVSVLRMGSLLLLLGACCCYLFTGLALGAEALMPLPRLALPQILEAVVSGSGSSSKEETPDEEPTYAQLCPELPDPRAVGHDLGPLFRHDGAIKAGCATTPMRVEGTATWVAPGLCENKLRSLGVSAPGYSPAIIYGTPAAVALSDAEQGSLVALEVSEPNEGDVYLLVTQIGTFAYVRPTRSLTGEDRDPRSCADVSGVARSFAKLEPVMVVLWLQLMQERREWVWPQPVAGKPERLTFTDHLDVAVVGEGSCAGPENCWLSSVSGKSEQGGSGFVSMLELAPYMPGS
jgi:hypothetical protein